MHYSGGDWMHISIVMAVFAASVIAILIIRSSYRKRSTLKSVLFALSTSTLVISGVLAIGFEWRAEKIYTQTSSVPSKATTLAKIKNTSCYLILDDDEYKFLCKDSNGEDKSQRVEKNNCEVTFGNEAPKIISKEVVKNCREEWLFLIGEVKQEKEVAYELVVPSEESILDTSRLKRAPAGP